MIGWVGRLWRAFWGYLDALARLDGAERDIERLGDRVDELRLDWINQTDKLAKLHQRAIARAQATTEALEASTPTVSDARLQRMARKTEILRRRMGTGGSA